MTPEFEAIATRVREQGKPFPGGDQLRETLHSRSLACSECGILPAEDPGDWIGLCHNAMDHARETGHLVAASSQDHAIYGPVTDHG
jgi:hypothetical protein